MMYNISNSSLIMSTKYLISAQFNLRVSERAHILSGGCIDSIDALVRIWKTVK